MLQLSGEYDSASLVFRSARTTWYRPTTLGKLLELKHEHPDARLVVGNTEVGQCRYCTEWGRGTVITQRQTSARAVLIHT